MTRYLSQTYSLSEKAALECAYSIIKQQETHGEKPSHKQVELYVHITQQLENKIPFKESEPAETIFLRRKEGELLLRVLLDKDTSSEGPLPFVKPLKSQIYARSSLQDLKARLEGEMGKLSQKGYSIL